MHDVYANQEIVSANFEGIDYTFCHYYEGGNRTIRITNNVNDIVDVVTYDETSALIYLNGEVLGSLVESINGIQVPAPRYNWQVVSSDSIYVSWAKGVAVAVVAAIAIPLAGLGTDGVITAIGTASLGVLASMAVGGTVYLKLRVMNIPNVPPQYQYEWKFVASAGDSYGPYYYVP